MTRKSIAAWIAAAALLLAISAFAATKKREGFSKYYYIETQAPIEDDVIFTSTDADLLLGSGYRNLPTGFVADSYSVPYAETDDLRKSV
jgi:hypothetical protein